MMRRFQLVRDVDETGVSGTGVVASGVVWDDGKVAMRWHTAKAASTGFYDSVSDVVAIHGHKGLTKLEWLDAEWGVVTVDREITEAQAAELKRQFKEQQVATKERATTVMREEGIPVGPPPIRTRQGIPYVPNEPDPSWWERDPGEHALAKAWESIDPTGRILVGIAIALVIALTIFAVAYQVRFG